MKGFMVIRHLDRILLSINGYDTKAFFYELVTSLKSCELLKYQGKKKFDFGGTSFVVPSFRCPEDYSDIALLLSHRDVRNEGTIIRYYFAYVWLSDPTPYSQGVLLDTIDSIRSNYEGIEMSPSEVEFALDFYPTRPSDLNALFRTLSASVVLRHSRPGSYACVCGKNGSITHYQGNGGNVRRTKHDLRSGVLTIDETGTLSFKKKQGKSGKGVRVYLTEQGAVRMELQMNRPALRKLHINSLPLSADKVDVMDFLQFRKRLDEHGLSRLVKVINKKSRVPMDGESLKRWFTTEMSRDMKVNSGCQQVRYNFEELPVAVQISVFKGLKKQYGFTNQVEEFFPSDKAMTRQIKNRLKSRLSM